MTKPEARERLEIRERLAIPERDGEPSQVDRLLSAASRLAQTIAATDRIIQQRADILRDPAQIRALGGRSGGRRPEMLSLTEAAARTGRHPEVLRRWCADGRIPAVRIGRTWAIAASVVDDLLAHSARSRPRLPSRSA